MAKQEHVTEKMSELHYGEQQFHPFMIQDSIEMKFNCPWVRWEVELSGPFKHFCLEHSSTKELFCSFGSARLLSYWFHNVPPQALILFLDIAQNHVSGGQPALNEEAKSLCILEEKKWVYFHIVCLCVCFCARIRDNRRMPCRLERALETHEVWQWGILLSDEVHFSGTPKFNPTLCLSKLTKYIDLI